MIGNVIGAAVHVSKATDIGMAHQNIALRPQLQRRLKVVMLSGDWTAYLLLIGDGTRP